MKGIENQKEFGLSTWAVKNRKTVYLFILMILVGGIGAYSSMPKENFPELQIPEIYIGVAYPGNSPKIIADKITDPIEKELNSIKPGMSILRHCFTLKKTIGVSLKRKRKRLNLF